MVFQCINIRHAPWEVLKTADFGLGFQHLPRVLANVNVCKTMSDPYIKAALGDKEKNRSLGFTDVICRTVILRPPHSSFITQF